MFHKSYLGQFGDRLEADQNGYVPESTDGPWGFVLDHGTERTHDDDGQLTIYGRWWRDVGYPAWRDAAVAATEKAEEAIEQWRGSN